MKLTVLGSGVLVPQKGHAPSCYLLEAKGQRLVFDLGSGSLQQLLRAGVDYKQVDAFFFSHFHPDHVHELPLLFIAAGLDKANKGKRLNLYGPKGLRKFLQDFFQLYPFMRKLKVHVNIRELANGSLKLGGLRVRSAVVKHTVGALAYRVEAGQKSFVFSGDSEDCLALRKLCWGASLAVLECSSPRVRAGKPFPGHLTAPDCAAIAQTTGVGHLVLSHLYPESAKANLKKIVREKFLGRLSIARDFAAFRF